MQFVDQILNKLDELIQQGRFEELETEASRSSQSRPMGGQWKERHKTINAFLNTRGGIVILGVKEEGSGPNRRYVFAGWKEHAEPNLKEIPRLFTDRKGVSRICPIASHPLNCAISRVAVWRCFTWTNWRRIENSFFTRAWPTSASLPETIKLANRKSKLKRSSRKRPSMPANSSPCPAYGSQSGPREAQPVHLSAKSTGAGGNHESRPGSGTPVLGEAAFIKDGEVTVLGALRLPQHLATASVSKAMFTDTWTVRNAISRTAREVESQVVQDKQDFVDNVLQLMESWARLPFAEHTGRCQRQGGRYQRAPVSEPPSCGKR